MGKAKTVYHHFVVLILSAALLAGCFNTFIVQKTTQAASKTVSFDMYWMNGETVTWFTKGQTLKIICRPKEAYNSSNNALTFTIYKDDEQVDSRSYSYTKDHMTEAITHEYKVSSYGVYRIVCQTTMGRTWEGILVVRKPSEAPQTKPQFYATHDMRTEVISDKAKIGLFDPSAKVTTQIYRATSKNGKYKCIKKTTGSSYTDNDLDYRTYYYKIRTVVKSGKKTYKSKFSEIITVENND